MTTAYLIVVEDVRSLHTAILYSTLHSVLCVLYVEVRKSLSSVVHFHLSTLYRAVMDMIKKEPEVDPLAIWSSDNIDTDEKKPLLQEGNFLDRNMIMLKEDCVDCNYDLKSEFVFKETAVPIDFSTVKNEAKMVSKYRHKTNRGSWTAEDLQRAIRAIQDGKSIRSVSKSTGISFSTLQERISKQNYNDPKLGKRSIFTPDQEVEMCNQLKVLANLFYGLTPNNVKHAAFQFAEGNKIEHPFSKETKMAGRYWLEGFLKRNPSLFLRKPEAVSINRIKGFNKEEVSKFYTNLEDVFLKYGFSASHVYNVDETGIGTVQEPETILAPKGQKRVGAATSAERGTHATVICAMSAAGNYIPPMFIYARKRMSPTLEKGGPPVALYSCSKNGWSNEELFLKWLKHFAHHARPTPENLSF
ncbi:uncharacterized protein [Periplaneta americana]|uniref:uncharacterized protein isoform X4 n=1 Tax=Periplaneta americana TaxID=6978 RepID=UPI0037E87AAB